MTYFSETMNLAHESGVWNQLQLFLRTFLPDTYQKRIYKTHLAILVLFFALLLENNLALFDRIPHSYFTALATIVVLGVKPTICLLCLSARIGQYGFDLCNFRHNDYNGRTTDVRPFSAGCTKCFDRR